MAAAAPHAVGEDGVRQLADRGYRCAVFNEHLSAVAAIAAAGANADKTARVTRVTAATADGLSLDAG